MPAEPAGGLLAPARAVLEPREAARRHQQTHVLGDRVVVPGRALAVERRQVLLVPPELPAALLVVLEQVRHLGPLVQQPADPHPRHEPDAELDPTGPVDARQQRVGGPPRAQLPIDRFGVPLVAGDPVGGRELRQVVVARELPDLLDVAGRRLVPRVDREGEDITRRGDAGHRVPEPVGVGQIRAYDAEQGPVTGQDPVTGRSGGRPNPGGDRVTGDHVDSHGTVELLRQPRCGRRAGSWTHAPGRPLLLPDVVARPA